MQRGRVAVVGGGVSGLTAAYLLRRSHDVTLFEREARLGGHAHTHEVCVGGQTLPVDSGFIVLNDRTYPLLGRLLDELRVALRATEMSMGIACRGCGLEYVGGRGAVGLFAQRRRMADPQFLTLLLSVRRFQRLALRHLETDPESLESYAEFLERHEFGTHFVRHYALPIVSCVWSSGHRDSLDYPAAYLFAFLSHHGFLSIGNAPQWYVVSGGSRAYVDRLADRLTDIQINRTVAAVTRRRDGVTLDLADGGRRDFDQVVIATHADEALSLLTDPSPAECDVLGAFRYSTNATSLHGDDSVLPTRRKSRASWNFRLDACDSEPEAVQVSYWMNRLQHHPDAHPLIVTLNAGAAVDSRAVIAKMSYTHPLFTGASVAAQRRLVELNDDRTAYAGAYHGWGFHEDGCRAGVAAAQHFGSSW